MVTGEKSESLLSTKVAQLCHLGPGAFSTDDRSVESCSSHQRDDLPSYSSQKYINATSKVI